MVIQFLVFFVKIFNIKRSLSFKNKIWNEWKQEFISCICYFFPEEFFELSTPLKGIQLPSLICLFAIPSQTKWCKNKKNNNKVIRKNIVKKITWSQRYAMNANIPSVRLKGVRLSIRQKRFRLAEVFCINMSLQINYLLKIRLIQNNAAILNRFQEKEKPFPILM